MKCFFRWMPGSSARLRASSDALCPGMTNGKRRTWSSGSNAFALARCDLDRVDDLGIGGAAAEIAREVVPDLLLVRVGMGVEQLRRHQHEAGRAVSALEGAGLDEGFLHGAEVERVRVR